MCGQYDWILAKILFSVASLSWTEMQSRFMSLPLPPNQKEKEREQQTCVGDSSLKLCGGCKAVADLREGSGGSGHPSAPLLFRVKKNIQKEEKPAWSGRASNPPAPRSRPGSASVRYRPSSNVFKKHKLTTQNIS